MHGMSSYCILYHWHGVRLRAEASCQPCYTVWYQIPSEDLTLLFRSEVGKADVELIHWSIFRRFNWDISSDSDANNELTPRLSWHEIRDRNSPLLLATLTRTLSSVRTVVYLTRTQTVHRIEFVHPFFLTTRLERSSSAVRTAVLLALPAVDVSVVTLARNNYQCARRQFHR